MTTQKQAIRRARELYVWVDGYSDPIPLRISKRQALDLVAHEPQFTVVVSPDSTDLSARNRRDDEDVRQEAS